MTRKLSCPIPLDQIPCLCGSSCWLRLKSSSYQPPQYSHQGAVTISASSATIFINTRRLAFPCATAILDFALVEFLIFVPASTCIIPYHRTLFLARSASPARSKTSTLPLLLTLLHFRPTFSATYLKTSIARPISRWYTLPDLVDSIVADLGCLLQSIKDSSHPCRRQYAYLNIILAAHKPRRTHTLPGRGMFTFSPGGQLGRTRCTVTPTRRRVSELGVNQLREHHTA